MKIRYSDALRARTQRLLLALLASAALIGTSGTAGAQELNIIRDTEIEHTLKAYARPLLEAGGINPDAVLILMNNDDTINAFTPGQNLIFFNTGSLIRAENSNQIIGVMAHEIGHMVGGHALATGDAYAQAGTIAMLTTLLGVAAGVASGNPDVGMAIAMGGQGTAARQFMSFSRGQESAADQFALRALEQTHQSPKGLYDFFSTIADQELLITDRQDPYVRTHPLNRDRMNAVGFALQSSPYGNVPPDPELERQHHRMVAKLFSFLKPQVSTLQRFPETDNSLEARYARSIAYYRRGQIDMSLPLIDGLITEYPDDPYFWELKGDMMLNGGKMDDAIVAYRRANTLMPEADLILVSMAHAMVESGNPDYAQEAQAALQASLRKDPETPFAWDLLAKSYLQSDQPGMSAYAAAERALIYGQFGDVMRYTQQAENLVERGTPTWYRIQDIKVAAQNSMQDMQSRRR